MALNGMTNCRLGNTQTFGGPADMAFRMHRTEHPEQIKIKIINLVHNVYILYEL